MLFPSSSTEILKIDITFAAGSAIQPQLLCATTAASLLPLASVRRDAQQVAEFLDQRGIIIAPTTDLVSTTLTAYTLKRYAGELVPLLHELLAQPAYALDDFNTQMLATLSRLQTNFQKTSYVARNIFYEQLYGSDTPEGRFATPDDARKLMLDVVRRFHEQHHRTDNVMLTLAGNYDDDVLSRLEQIVAPHSFVPRFETSQPLDMSSGKSTPTERRVSLFDTPQPQASVRMGCILPFYADSDDYACFNVLCNVLGGYFGSRLMSNLREDKGYTYGIYSHVNIMRHSLCFNIVTDVSADAVEQSVEEVRHELRRLCDEPVPEDELVSVRHYMEGEYLRSIDGPFERADRWRSLTTRGINEKSFTERLIRAQNDTTPAQLQQLACRCIAPQNMTTVIVN